MCAFVYLVLEVFFSEESAYSDDPVGGGGWGVGADQYVKKRAQLVLYAVTPKERHLQHRFSIIILRL